MTPDLILKNIGKHIDLAKEEEIFFISVLIGKEISKKTLILHEGQICKYISFVHSGALRAFHIDKEGKEATIMFAVTQRWRARLSPGQIHAREV